jgi:hypothetical protein
MLDELVSGMGEGDDGEVYVLTRRELGPIGAPAAGCSASWPGGYRRNDTGRSTHCHEGGL